MGPVGRSLACPGQLGETNMLDEGDIYLVKQSKYPAILFDCDTRGYVWPAIRHESGQIILSFLDLQYVESFPSIRLKFATQYQNMKYQYLGAGSKVH